MNTQVIYILNVFVLPCPLFLSCILLYWIFVCVVLVLAFALYFICKGSTHENLNNSWRNSKFIDTKMCLSKLDPLCSSFSHIFIFYFRQYKF